MASQWGGCTEGWVTLTEAERVVGGALVSAKSGSWKHPSRGCTAADLSPTFGNPVTSAPLCSLLRC